jgi:hypothetical protein
MIKNRKIGKLVLVVLIAVGGAFFLLQCDLGGDDGSGDDGGGEGADFDDTLYYTKSEVDSLVATAVENATAGVYAIASADNNTVANDIWTLMDFNFQHADTSDMFTATSTKIICRSAGVYQIVGQVEFPAITETGVILGVQIVESSMYNIGNETVFASPADDTTETMVTVNMILPLDENDTVELKAYQTSSSDLSGAHSWLSVAKIGG